MNIIILGPQGSGKGTQAKLLAEKFNLEHLETGRILREMALKNTPLAKKVEALVNRGFIVPDKIVAQILQERIKNIPKKKGIIFDGVPRDMTQVKFLEKILKQEKRKVTHAFFLWISRRETIKRLTKRCTCLKCGAVFILGKDIKETKKCPKCGGKVYQRKDDRPESIKRRLISYYQKTLPVIRHFYLSGRGIEINGEQSIKKVFEDILDNFL